MSPCTGHLTRFECPQLGRIIAAFMLGLTRQRWPPMGRQPTVRLGQSPPARPTAWNGAYTSSILMRSSRSIITKRLGIAVDRREIAGYACSPFRMLSEPVAVIRDLVRTETRNTEPRVCLLSFPHLFNLDASRSAARSASGVRWMRTDWFCLGICHCKAALSNSSTE